MSEGNVLFGKRHLTKNRQQLMFQTNESASTAVPEPVASDCLREPILRSRRDIACLKSGVCESWRSM
ncbi:hypothetical protein RBSH_00288 [Rhodopirellula baltica SH28]|uniref:Uncharacterized protein n=1 Tax=Rhodopirellula baltica SH28 TaxID=993517 RepID=K5DNF7_RHOBT|nr:hypothetical protein RBSH_00288 [Rhodopirellula baltica SH28]